MRTKFMVSTIVMMTITLLGGCGTPSAPKPALNTTPSVQQSSASAQNALLPPFTNNLNVEKGTPSNQFDAIAVSPSKFQQIPVLDSTGHLVLLNPAKQPVLIEAYWCPHCQRTLVMLNRKNLKNPPVLAAAGFPQGTTLQEALARTQAEEKAFHLKFAKVYYMIDPKVQSELITEFPELIFSNKGRLEKLQGEHTWSIWKKVLD